MLILTRKISQAVYLTTQDGTVITVAIDGIGQREVRLAFDAPNSVKIVRDDAKQKERER